MRSLLVLAQHPELADAIRGSLNPESYRVLQRADIAEAEPLLAHGLVDVCLLDVDTTNVQSLWLVEQVRRRARHCPIIIFTGSKQWEWEEEAYLQGVSYVLTKPVRGRMLSSLLERLWPSPGAPTVSAVVQSRSSLPAVDPLPLRPSAPAETALAVLRDFSAVFSHSLEAEPLLRHFLLLLREILGVNRSAIFLRVPTALFPATEPSPESRQMRAACALGLPSGLLEHFELSFETGIGGFLHEHGRILRRGAPEAQGNDQIEKEFQILGAQVAIPILDREKLIGVAAFDGRVTGEPIGSSELTLVFHLLEELALAVKNIWLHDQLAANHETLADILRQLSTACVVVSRDLKVLHVNKRARQLFPQTGPRTELDFSDLPQALGSKVYQVLRTGTTLAPFKFHPDDARRNVYNVTVIPLQREHAEGPHAAVLLVDDITQTEQLQQLEIEAANLRLVKTMADRLAHEIGNAMVPLSTHQQLLADKYRDPEFRASLDHALADGVKRVTRLINQMRFLARDTILSSEAFPLVPLVEEAYQEALKHQPFKSASLKQNAPSQPVVVSGERPALKHAIAEVILNALQANPAEPKVEVRSKVEADSAGTNWLHIEVQDNGAGFSAAALKMLPEPFYTTRNVGLGLGLTVTRKIVETHRGKLVIGDVQNGKQGVVRISLPLAKEGNTSTGGGRQVPASKAT